MAQSALLVMDVQNGIVNSLLGDNRDAYLETVSSVIDTARQANLPVIFVVVRFRQGFPEVSPDNLSFSKLKDRGTDFQETAAAAQPALTPKPEEVIVTKRRVSAFSGSDLEVVLRAQRIDHLILTGIATSGVVLSTLREAADKDYRLTVIADACYDADNSVHDVLTTKIFPKQANVLTAVDWIKAVKKQG